MLMSWSFDSRCRKLLLIPFHPAPSHACRTPKQNNDKSPCFGIAACMLQELQLSLSPKRKSGSQRTLEIAKTIPDSELWSGIQYRDVYTPIPVYLPPRFNPSIRAHVSSSGKPRDDTNSKKKKRWLQRELWARTYPQAIEAVSTRAGERSKNNFASAWPKSEAGRISGTLHTRLNEACRDSCGSIVNEARSWRNFDHTCSYS